MDKIDTEKMLGNWHNVMKQNDKVPLGRCPIMDI